MSTKGPTGPQHCISGVHNTSPPTLADGQQGPIQLDASGNVLISGNITASNASVGPNGSPIPTSSNLIGVEDGSGNLQPVSASNPLPISGTISASSAATASASPPTYAPGSQPFSQDLSGHLRTISEIDQTTPGATNLVDASNFPVTVDTNAGAVGGSTIRVVLATGGATPLPTGAATSANQPTNATQGSASSGQTGTLALGAASTSAPTYSNGQTNPLSLDLAGNLRVNVVTGGAGGGAVFGPTAVGSAAANPPVLMAGTANAGATGTVQVAKVDSSGNQYTSTVLTAGAATIGSIANTSFAATQSGTWTVGISASQSIAVTQGAAASLNATVVGTGTFAVQAAVVSVSATGSAVPVSADYTGLIAKTANPSAASDGNLVGAMADKLGRQVVVIGNVRDNKASSTITLSSTSSATLVAAVASTFNDIYGLIAANQSATGVTITLSSSSGATGIPLYIPANDTRGFMLPSSDGLKQNTVNTNWTAALSAGSITVKATALYVKNI